MVFQKFKEDVVVEKGWATIKDIKNLASRLALFFIFFAIGLGLVTYCTVGWLVTLIVIILTGIGYVWVFDMADEDEESFKLVQKCSKLWWLSIVFDVLRVVVLKLTNFL